MSSHLDRFHDWVPLAHSAGYQPVALAGLCSVSRRQLERHFGEHFRSTPQVWLRDLRLKEGCELLLQGRYVKAVAFELRFKDPSHFCRMFKLRYGLSPLAFVAHQTEMSRLNNECRV